MHQTGYTRFTPHLELRNCASEVRLIALDASEFGLDIEDYLTDKNIIILEDATIKNEESKESHSVQQRILVKAKITVYALCPMNWYSIPQFENILEAKKGEGKRPVAWGKEVGSAGGLGRRRGVLAGGLEDEEG
ncbi:hypothetical protein IEQ34_014040 [Dendrobium chrysotoxum]|uniref:Uncharacterized protein n=1 Tax=Dendrobium chrysotoxum TaxID=161865 RepID=A0AAV7GKD5_DENCH|nr:hypothetical protein IEQ34_014040 [Dendrobium chrysotoxum]